MKAAINFTESEKLLISKLEYLDDRSRSNLIKKNIIDLSLDRILTICATSWNRKASDLLGKINHNDQTGKHMKLSFYSAMVVYSNLEYKDLELFADYRGSMMFGVLGSLLKGLKYNKHTPLIMQLFASLDKACPTRLNKLTEIDYTMIQGVDHTWPACKLTAYQISRIPVKDVAWFHNDNKAMTILGYHSSRLNECKYINHNQVGNDSLLYMMQSQGYRFLEFKQHWAYEKMHPLCDRCILKNDCRRRGLGLYSDPGKEFKCFKAIPERAFKVDIELLYPMKQFQLQ